MPGKWQGSERKIQAAEEMKKEQVRSLLFFGITANAALSLTLFIPIRWRVIARAGYFFAKGFPGIFR